MAAVELLLAGAQAVQVGTATFAEPDAAARIDRELTDWCIEHGVDAVSELSGQDSGERHAIVGRPTVGTLRPE